MRRTGQCPKVTILSKATPQMQSWCAENEKRAFFGTYPTLCELRAENETMTLQWLAMHLADLSTYCGARNMDNSQLGGLAKTILAEYGYLKLTEVMLFIHRFKVGAFGTFYGSVDPLTITNALLKFIKYDRGEAYDKRIQEEREERERKEREEQPPMSYLDYCAKHGITPNPKILTQINNNQQ